MTVFWDVTPCSQTGAHWHLEEEHSISRVQVEAEHGKSTDVGKARVSTEALSKHVGLRRTITECRAHEKLFSKSRQSGKSRGKIRRDSKEMSDT
jgi:hypothetical protein